MSGALSRLTGACSALRSAATTVSIGVALERMTHGSSTGDTDADLVDRAPGGGEKIFFAGEGASAATMDVQLQTLAYQASLRLNPTVIQPSLIYFLR